MIAKYILIIILGAMIIGLIAFNVIIRKDSRLYEQGKESSVTRHFICEVYRHVIPLWATFCDKCRNPINNPINRVENKARVFSRVIDEANSINENSHISWDEDLVTRKIGGTKPQLVLRNDLKKCEICRGFIHDPKDLTTCPSCQASFHFNHITEWLKIKGKCPVCHEGILISQF